jgi:hypothetical protein
MKKCEALEGCKIKIRYTVIDHTLKKTVHLCEAHFKQGMKAFLMKDPIIGHLMREGYI